MGPTYLESEKQIVCWIESLNIERNLFTELDGDSNREPKWLFCWRCSKTLEPSPPKTTAHVVEPGFMCRVVFRFSAMPVPKKK